MPDEKTMDDAPPHYNADSASAWAAGYNEAVASMSVAAADILAERQRQMSVEGWTQEHDDQHDAGQMALAAAAYILRRDHRTEYKLFPVMQRVDVRSAEDPTHHHVGNVSAPKIWPWYGQWWKPKDRRRDLVRAAALIVAEIERLDRAEQSQPKQA